MFLIYLNLLNAVLINKSGESKTKTSQETAIDLGMPAEGRNQLELDWAARDCILNGKIPK